MLSLDSCYSFKRTFMDRGQTLKYVYKKNQFIMIYMIMKFNKERVKLRPLNTKFIKIKFKIVTLKKKGFLGESRDVLSIQCTCKDFYENLNCPYLLYDFQILGEPGNDKVKNVIAHVEYPPAAIACLEMYASCGNLKAINL